MPVYIVAIYNAHYFDLNYEGHTEGFEVECGLNRFDLTKMWASIELKLFYSYVISGIEFLSIA